jgi:hypothetical protein
MTDKRVQVDTRQLYESKHAKFCLERANQPRLRITKYCLRIQEIGRFPHGRGLDTRGCVTTQTKRWESNVALSPRQAHHLHMILTRFSHVFTHPAAGRRQGQWLTHGIMRTWLAMLRTNEVARLTARDVNLARVAQITPKAGWVNA